MSTSPRRTQRSKKVCAFQVKKATGRTVVRSAKLPSTRQYTRGAEFGLCFSCSKSFSSPDLGTITSTSEVEAYCKQTSQKGEESSARTGVPNKVTVHLVDALYSGHAIWSDLFRMPEATARR